MLTRGGLARGSGFREERRRELAFLKPKGKRADGLVGELSLPGGRIVADDMAELDDDGRRPRRCGVADVDVLDPPEWTEAAREDRLLAGDGGLQARSKHHTCRVSQAMRLARSRSRPQTQASM